VTVEPAPQHAPAGRPDTTDAELRPHRGVIDRAVGRARGLGPRGQAAAAFGGYLAVSMALWWWRLFPRFGAAYLSGGWSDARFDAWCLGWWPHAILHGWDPLHAGVLWAPAGVNTALVTSMPGPSILLAPLTLAAGPVVTENVLFLLAPALAGWAAYLLCRRITGRFWPSVAGGYAFGLSTFLTVQMAGHLNLALVFPVPLCAYLVVRRVEGSLTPRRFTILLALTLLLALSTSTEIFVTMTFVGGLVVLGGLAFGVPEVRRSLLRALPAIGLAYVIAILVAAPLVVATSQGLRTPPVPIRTHATPAVAYQEYLQHYSVDLLGFVLPRPRQLLGASLAAPAAAGIGVAASEDAAYVGLPLLAVVVLSALTERRRRAAWLLLALFLACVVLALGPTLQVGGTGHGSLPWTWVARFAILRPALPARFMVFAWLTLGVIVATWLAAAGRSAWLRGALVVLGLVAILPSVRPPSSAAVPAFFSRGLYRSYLQPGSTVLAIPFYTPNTSMPWQVAADYSFRLAGAYVGFRAIPDQAASLPVVEALVADKPWWTSPAELAAYLARHDVRAVVVLDREQATWGPILASLHLTAVPVGGISLYRVPAPG